MYKHDTHKPYVDMSKLTLFLLKSVLLCFFSFFKRNWHSCVIKFSFDLWCNSLHVDHRQSELANIITKERPWSFFKFYLQKILLMNILKLYRYIKFKFPSTLLLWHLIKYKIGGRGGGVDFLYNHKNSIKNKHNFYNLKQVSLRQLIIVQNFWSLKVYFVHIQIV